MVRSSESTSSIGEKIARALVMGETSGITNRQLLPYKQLGLLHLFTPSGTHLTALLKFLPIATCRKWIPLFSLVLLGFFITLYLVPIQFFALQRMALWNFLREINTFLPVNFNIQSTFLLTFIIDFFWGTWTSSPLSFCYSFIFCWNLFIVNRSRNCNLAIWTYYCLRYHWPILR